MHTRRFNTFLKDGCNSVWVQFQVYRHFYIFFSTIQKKFIFFYFLHFENDYIEYNDIQNKIFPNFQLDQCSSILNNPESSGSSITECIVRKTIF